MGRERWGERSEVTVERRRETPSTRNHHKTHALTIAVTAPRGITAFLTGFLTFSQLTGKVFSSHYTVMFLSASGVDWKTLIFPTRCWAEAAESFLSPPVGPSRSNRRVEAQTLGQLRPSSCRESNPQTQSSEWQRRGSWAAHAGGWAERETFKPVFKGACLGGGGGSKLQAPLPLPHLPCQAN